MNLIQSAISICLFFSGCSYNESVLVREMDNAYNVVNSGSYDYEKLESIRNENVNSVVLRSFASMGEELAVTHLINSKFRVIKYEENGLRVINDGTFKPYRDESYKKSALSNLQGNSRYLATKTYKGCVFCSYEARVIFDVNNNSLVNLRGYVFFHSI